MAVARRALGDARRVDHGVKQRRLHRAPRALFPIVKLIRGVQRIRNTRFFQLAGHKTGERERGRRRRGFQRLRRRPSPDPAYMPGLLLPAARAVNALANGRLLRRRAGRPRVFAVGAQRPPRENMPLRQHVMAALRRQFQYRQIFRHGAKARRNKNHPLRIRVVKGFNHVAVEPVELLRIMVEPLCRLVDDIKPQQRMLLAEIVGHRAPPGDHFGGVLRARISLKGVRLVGDYRDDVVTLARLDDFAQMDEPLLGGVTRHPHPHMANAPLLKIAYRQRVELADAAIGARPVDVHPHAEFGGIALGR
ncbi:hypothetical protein BN134_3516 [Cronobacter dublinensis 1210]|uniref:Uncharacterized protein n=1 Tax=Cronobacter dublinensis 1210 TaxID=1208656 RepID=A0ABM9QAX2_9ENTR|nr:hypothetical protein BN134_3516 [Cronobacter dublinensis 1210]